MQGSVELLYFFLQACWWAVVIDFILFLQHSSLRLTVDHLIVIAFYVYVLIKKKSFKGISDSEITIFYVMLCVFFLSQCYAVCTCSDITIHVRSNPEYYMEICNLFIIKAND